jgi:hypothetical protein
VAARPAPYYPGAMSLYDDVILQPKKMLANLDKWLEAGAAHAQKNKFEPEVLLTSRLAPNQYPLVRQIQSACDAAKSMAGRSAGKELPKHPDTEQTMAEARQRVATVIAYLDSFTTADFDGADARVVELPWLEGKVMTVANFVREMQTPNFYFHLTTAYAILRHNGVELGKRDFIGDVTLRAK